MKTLVIVPTRNRLEKFSTMLNSFCETASDDCFLFIRLDSDDDWEKYLKIYVKAQDTHDRLNFTISHGERKKPIEIFNIIFNLFPELDYYMAANDDFIFKTKNWDKLMQTDGICYANDLIHQGRLATISLINGDLVRKLGWIQYPKLDYLFADNVWHEIGKQLDKLYYKNDVIIEHDHFLKNGIKDEIAKETNHPDTYKSDGLKFIQWLTTESHKDILKLKESYGNKSNS